MRWTFPELIHPQMPADQPGERSPASQPNRFTRRSMRFMATRRLTECRDGYNKLRPFLNDSAIPPEQTRVHRATEEIKACSALTLKALNPAGTADQRHDAADEDTRQLVAISRTLRKQDLSWCGQDPRSGDRSDTAAAEQVDGRSDLC